MFLTVFGQKGGVAKTCTSVHLSAVWARRGFNVCLVDADRNRSATAYGARGLLDFSVVPIEAAAKATRAADIVVTDGQASSQDDELNRLSEGSDLIVLPTTPQARSVELTIELASMLRSKEVPACVLMVKVDSRKQRYAHEAKAILVDFGLQVLSAEIPLLAAFDKAEVQGGIVMDAVDDRGRADRRRMLGWTAYCAAAAEIESIHRAAQAEAGDSGLDRLALPVEASGSGEQGAEAFDIERACAQQGAGPAETTEGRHIADVGPDVEETKERLKQGRCDCGVGKCSAVQSCDHTEQGSGSVESEGFEAVLVGPAGPSSPSGQAFEHRPGRTHVGHGEIRLGAGGSEGHDAQDHNGP
jgi:chromosome partitioning protein